MKMEFKIDWGSIIVDIVKKKDLDTGDFGDCWEEDYDWTELDLYVMGSFWGEVVSWGLVRIEMEYPKLKNWKEKDVEKDLESYRNHIEEEEKNVR